MANGKPRLRRDPLRVPRPVASEVVEAQAEQLAELEIVFELYCALWDQTAAMSPYDGYQFVLDELSESSASEALREVLADLRRLPFVASAPGTMTDRDRTWFGLQIMLNELLQQGKHLLAPERLASLDVRAAAEEPPSLLMPAGEPRP